MSEKVVNAPKIVVEKDILPASMLAVFSMELLPFKNRPDSELLTAITELVDWKDLPEDKQAALALPISMGFRDWCKVIEAEKTASDEEAAATSRPKLDFNLMTMGDNWLYVLVRTFFEKGETRHLFTHHNSNELIFRPLDVVDFITKSRQAIKDRQHQETLQ